MGRVANNHGHAIDLVARAMDLASSLVASTLGDAPSIIPGTGGVPTAFRWQVRTCNVSNFYRVINCTGRFGFYKAVGERNQNNHTSISPSSEDESSTATCRAATFATGFKGTAVLVFSLALAFVKKMAGVFGRGATFAPGRPAPPGAGPENDDVACCRITWSPLNAGLATVAVGGAVGVGGAGEENEDLRCCVRTSVVSTK